MITNKKAGPTHLNAVPEEDLAEHVGKEMADKIIASNPPESMGRMARLEKIHRSQFWI